MSYASSAIKRLSNEYRHLQKPENRVREYFVAPLEENIFEWHFTLRGPGGDDGSLPYKDGIYHGALIFSRSYPLEPPDIVFFTRSGRFSVHEKICSTISSYHKELWQPTYDVALTLTALRHFMAQEDEVGVGAFRKNMVPHATKVEWAADTWHFRCEACGRATAEVWETEMKMHPEISPEKEAQVPKLPPPQQLSAADAETPTPPATEGADAEEAAASAAADEPQDAASAAPAAAATVEEPPASATAADAEAADAAAAVTDEAAATQLVRTSVESEAVAAEEAEVCTGEAPPSPPAPAAVSTASNEVPPPPPPAAPAAAATAAALVDSAAPSVEPRPAHPHAVPSDPAEPPPAVPVAEVGAHHATAAADLDFADVTPARVVRAPLIAEPRPAPATANTTTTRSIECIRFAPMIRELLRREQEEETAVPPASSAPPATAPAPQVRSSERASTTAAPVEAMPTIADAPASAPGPAPLQPPEAVDAHQQLQQQQQQHALTIVFGVRPLQARLSLRALDRAIAWSFALVMLILVRRGLCDFFFAW